MTILINVIVKIILTSIEEKLSIFLKKIWEG